MKIEIKKSRFRWQKWCIWIHYNNGKKVRLNQFYYNKDDAADSAEMIKKEMPSAKIIY